MNKNRLNKTAQNKRLGNMAADEYPASAFVFQFGVPPRLDGTQPSFCTIFELNNKAKHRAARLTNKSVATSHSMDKNK